VIVFPEILEGQVEGLIVEVTEDVEEMLGPV
jgi:hypothetical protein